MRCWEMSLGKRGEESLPGVELLGKRGEESLLGVELLGKRGEESLLGVELLAGWTWRETARDRESGGAFFNVLPIRVLT
jgi:hypothetical protein